MSQIEESKIIDNFRNYLESQKVIKTKTLEDLKILDSFDDTIISWYEGQIKELEYIKRSFELIVLGEDMN